MSEIEMDRTHVRYSPLPATDEDTATSQTQRRRSFASSLSRDTSENEYEHDRRFDYKPKERIPWKSIGLAAFLLVMGTTLLIISHFLFTGHMGGDRSQAFGFLAIGFLMFLPGFYETRIAYYSWRGAKGYTFAHIPDY